MQRYAALVRTATAATSSRCGCRPPLRSSLTSWARSCTLEIESASACWSYFRRAERLTQEQQILEREIQTVQAVLEQRQRAVLVRSRGISRPRPGSPPMQGPPRTSTRTVQVVAPPVGRGGPVRLSCSIQSAVTPVTTRGRLSKSDGVREPVRNSTMRSVSSSSSR